MQNIGVCILTEWHLVGLYVLLELENLMDEDCQEDLREDGAIQSSYIDC